jgi:hypothetical protein
MWWIDGRGVYLHSQGQRIKQTNGVFVVNSGKLTKYIFM